MFTLNRSLLFINSEFVVCMFENIEVFFFLIEFFLENRTWSFSTIGVFLCFLPGLCAFIMYVQSAVNQIIRPYFIGSVPSTLSDVSALVVLRYKS